MCIRDRAWTESGLLIAMIEATCTANMKKTCAAWKSPSASTRVSRWCFRIDARRPPRERTRVCVFGGSAHVSKKRNPSQAEKMMKVCIKYDTNICTGSSSADVVQPGDVPAYSNAANVRIDGGIQVIAKARVESLVSDVSRRCMY